MELVPVGASDIPRVRSMLARAFADDPFVRWFARNDEHRDEAFDLFFEVALAMSLPHGNTFMTPDAQGAALWFPPGKWKMGILQQLLVAPKMVRAMQLRRVPRVLSGVNRILAMHPKEPHHYLYVLGVDPSAQGRGLGADLIAPTLAECDRTGLPAYLETANERNLTFYRRHGFSPRAEVPVSPACHIWCMWRPPRA